MRGPRWTENTIKRFLAEGRGSGTGGDYKPWLTVQDLSSQGESRRALGLKTGREHHLFSNVEWELFLLLEWSSDITDIREQFPLDRALTLEIAALLGIPHPCYPDARVPTVMTADMLVTRSQNGVDVLEAFNAKRSEEAEDARSLEKLEIQRHYFELAGIPHRLVFHSEIPHQEARNIEWIRGAFVKPGESLPYPAYYDEHQQLMAGTLSRHPGDGSLTDFCATYDRLYGTEPGTGLRIAKLLMLNRTLQADLSNADLPSAPLASFRLLRSHPALKLVGEK